MQNERRKGQEAIPAHLTDVLSDAQVATVRGLQKFGWRLLFVRRPLFQDPQPIMESPRHSEMGAIDLDGVLDTTSDLRIRLAA